MQHTLMLQKMIERNWTQKQENASFWVTVLEGNIIVYMIQKRQVFFVVEMLLSMNCQESTQEEKRVIKVEAFAEEETEEEEESSDDEVPCGTDESVTAEGDSPSVPQPVRRSSRHIRPPDRYGFQAHATVDVEQEPQSVVEVMNSIEKEKWTEAMKKEMDSIYSNDVWDLVKPLKDHKVIGSKWVFKRKTMLMDH